jgi:cobyrinic acid a,c-diamide synthase
LAIVDVARLTDCRLPARPDSLDGILLDGVADYGSLCRLQTHMELLWGAPVVGAMGSAPELRAAIGRLAFGESPGPELIANLATAVERFTDIGRLDRLARKYDFPFRSLEGNWQGSEQSSLRIAMACDEVFRCYFPDTLEALEMRGATICDFSPLKDERLPPEVDIVYFGCGRPDLFAADLAANTCMTSSLREHLCSGRRIYAECGGLAYLSRHIELPDGRHLPMAGALPVAMRLREPEAPKAIEARLNADCWLGRHGALVRGYLNSRWTILGADPPCSGSMPCSGSAPAADGAARNGSPGRDGLPDSLPPRAGASNPFLIARHQAIGSRLHLDFAAQPDVLDAFFHPHAAMMDIDTPALARAL